MGSGGSHQTLLLDREPFRPTARGRQSQAASEIEYATIQLSVVYFFFSKKLPSIERDSNWRCCTFNCPSTECQPM